jgi:ribosome-binding ATPase YchF (GTP1/OBG family)
LKNTTLESQLQTLGNSRLPLWNEFPDFELYMDQLVSLGNRYLKNLQESEITASMVNSYVKKGLMHRPDKKKYDTTNVAELVVISLLKSIYSLETIKKCLQAVTKDTQTEQSYNYFAQLFNKTLAEISNNSFSFDFNYQDDLITSTEKFAVHAVIYKIIGEKAINLKAPN